MNYPTQTTILLFFLGVSGLTLVHEKREFNNTRIERASLLRTRGMRMNHLYLHLQQNKFFYVDDLFNGSHQKVVEHFGHRHIWDILEKDGDNVTVVQDTESTNVDLVVELLEIDTLTWN